MIPEQQLLDKFTRSDELQAMMISLLQEIRDKSIDVTIPPGADLAELINILKFQQDIDFKPFTLTYPRDGTRLTIAAGTTTFDFLAGTVAAPGAAIADMGNSLMLQRKDFMRALSINADHDTVVRIGSADKMPIRAGSFPIFPFRQFTTVEIAVTEATEILISASTSSAAIIQMGGETSPSTHEFTGDVYEGEHTMEAADGWDLSEAAYAQAFSVATQETDPEAIFFKPDGIKMYVLGDTGDDVNEYDLSTAWDVTSAVYLQNFSVAAQDTRPHGIFFKPDGTKMYILGDVGGDVNEYDLGAAWDVSSAVYLQNFSVPQAPGPMAIFFKPDGLKMYVICAAGDDVNEYDLGAAWDVSSAVYLQNFSVPQAPGPMAIFFKPDGLKMYVICAAGDDVNEYDLGAAWDVSSAVYLQNFSVAAQDTTPQGIFFKSDGLKMYVSGGDGDDVNEYDLSTAWDVTSAVYLQNFSVAAQDTTPQGIFFSPDGAKMYLAGSEGDSVYQYNIGYRFSTSRLLLRDVIIRVSAQDAVLGNTAQQRYPKAAGSACGFTKVDLSKLYFANANPSNNTKINILGVRL